MADRVRVALLGVDQPHASGYRESLLLMPEVEIVALYDPSLERARAVLPAALREAPLYDDIPTLLAERRPEAVWITLPNDATPGAIQLAAEAGAHVFAEKPCARTAAEFLPAAAAIRRAGVQFATGYTRHHAPIALAIKEMAATGRLGRLVSIEGRIITTSVTKRNPAHVLFDATRSGGGIVHWLGCHHLDLMRFTTGAEVVEVAAIAATLSGEPIGVEDAAVLALRFDNGMVGSLHCAYVTDQAGDNYFGLRGTGGWARWDPAEDEFTAHSTHPSWSAGSTRTLRVEPDAVGGYAGAMGMTGLHHFIATFRAGATPSFTTDDALRVLEVLDALHESSRTGRRVAVARHG